MAIGTLAYKILMDNKQFINGSVQTKKELNEGRRLTERMKTPQEKFQQNVIRTGVLLKTGAITQETHNRLLRKHETDLRRATSAKNQFNSAQSRGVGIMSSVGGRLAGLAAAYLSVHSAIRILRFGIRETNEAFKETDALAKRAANLNITAASQQTLELTAKLAGTTETAVANVFNLMQRRTSEARLGLDSAKRSFDQLNISVDEFAKLSSDKGFALLIDRIREIKDQNEQARITADLFGRGGKELLVVIRQGSQAIDESNQFLKERNLLLSQSDVKAIQDTNDEWTRTKTILDGVWQRLAVEISPELSNMAIIVGDLVSDADTMDSAFATIKITLQDVNAALIRSESILQAIADTPRKIDFVMSTRGRLANFKKDGSNIVPAEDLRPLTNRALRIEAEIEAMAKRREARKVEFEEEKKVNNDAVMIEMKRTQQDALRNKMIAEATKLTETHLTAQQKLEQQISKINDLFFTGPGNDPFINRETYIRAFEKAHEDFRKATESEKDSIEKAIKKPRTVTQQVQVDFASIERGTAKAFDIRFGSKDNGRKVEEDILTEAEEHTLLLTDIRDSSKSSSAITVKNVRI